MGRRSPSHGRPRGNRGRERVFAALDGRTTLADLLTQLPLANHADIEAVIPAALTARVIVDSRCMWSLFHRLSDNPGLLPALAPVESAYGLPRWRPAAPGLGRPIDSVSPAFDELTARRRSSVFQSPISGARSEQIAISVANSAYRLSDGSGPVASAGALHPLQLFVIGQGTKDPVLHVIDHDNGRSYRMATEPRNIPSYFLEEPVVLGALERGAAAVIIAADPERTTLKYANRGWRYVLMEAGAVAHQIQLNCIEAGVESRPVGGYHDWPLAELLGGELLVLATVLIGAE